MHRQVQVSFSRKKNQLCGDFGMTVIQGHIEFSSGKLACFICGILYRNSTFLTYFEFSEKIPQQNIFVELRIIIELNSACLKYL